MKKPTAFLFGLSLLVFTAAYAGPYSGPKGGGSAIDEPVPGFVGADGDGFVGGANYLNPVFKGWATRVVKYAPVGNIDDTWTNADMALGPIYKVNPRTPYPIPSLEYATVSLGDLSQQQIIDKICPGKITLGFDLRITNGEGYDFVVFENALSNGNNAFLELAYVEVSTNGIDFVRFPSLSLNGPEPDHLIGSPEEQLAFSYRDATNVYNLAGKHHNSGDESWGTGFDLNDLRFEQMVIDGVVKLDDINYIRLVDIPGNGLFLDSQGNPIYDAWETIASGGFDLAGIGIINGVAVPEPAITVLALLLAGLGAALLKRRRKTAFIR